MDIGSMTPRFVTRRIPITPGLHVLRYVSATDAKRPPAVLVAPKPDEAAGLNLVFPPTSPNAMLAAIGDCVVISAAGPCAVLVTTASLPTATSDDVELRVDRLDARDDRRAGLPVPARATASPEPRQGGSPADPYAGIFDIAGHVQRRGDCKAGSDGWLGSPSSPQRIEAFGVAWARSTPGLRLQYGCEVEDGTQHAAKVPGQLVGTRGQARGLTAVRFALGGKRAQEFELVVAASFDGGTPRQATGRQIEIAGKRGERLTGLQVGLREAPAVRSPERTAAAAIAPGRAPAAAPGSRTALPARVAPAAAPALAPAPEPARSAAPAERPRIRVFRASRAAV